MSLITLPGDKKYIWANAQCKTEKLAAELEGSLDKEKSLQLQVEEGLRKKKIAESSFATKTKTANEYRLQLLARKNLASEAGIEETKKKVSSSVAVEERRLRLEEQLRFGHDLTRLIRGLPSLLVNNRSLCPSPDTIKEELTRETAPYDFDFDESLP
jgi:hypothetical protein